MKNKPRSISDKEADRSLINLDTGEVEPFEMNISSASRNDSACQPTSGNSPKTDPIVLRVLMVIVKKPMLPSSKYPKLSGISPNTWQELRTHFVEKGWIRQHHLKIKSRGRSTLLIEPLPLGIQIANKSQDEEGNHAG